MEVWVYVFTCAVGVLDPPPPYLSGGDSRFDHASGHSSGIKCVKYGVEK